MARGAHTAQATPHTTGIDFQRARAEPLNSNLTPGITRRAFNLETTQANDESRAIRGRVHAVVRRRLIINDS